MNYIIYFEYAAISIILFTLFFLVTQKDLAKRENKILLALCVINLFAAVADILAYHIQMDIPRYGVRLATFLNELHLIPHTQMAFILIWYIIEMLGIRNKLRPWHYVVICVPSVILLLVLLFNPWLHWYFYYNEANVYSYGPMAPVIFGVPFLHMVIALYLLIRYRQVLQKKMLFAISLFFALAMASIIIQFLFREWLIELYAEALGLLGTTLALENKDEMHLLVESMEKVEAERQRAEAANRSKSDFLANMSHEIRTPINAVLGMNEMVMRETAQAKENLASGTGNAGEALNKITVYAGNIRSAGHNLLAIINDILDFSKIESGKMELVTGEFRLSSVLNDVSNMILFRARAKNLDFQVEVDETLPDGLKGDEVRVRQILTNILNNAVKYTNEGSVTLRVYPGDGTEPDRGQASVLLCFAVTDTGIGIREKDKEKLFSKFSRVDIERNKTVEGTGLGLAITQSLLQMMNGTIEVESEYGTGSTFTVTIPLEVYDTSPVGNFHETFEQSLLETTGYHESFRAPEARILAVDDTAVNLTVLKGLLSETQVKINTATSGAQALEMTKDIPFDLILMDQRMPQMDGTQTMHHIREQEDGVNRKTPVICLTADVVQGAKERYLSEGFTDYLSKPVEGVQLEAMLRKHLPEDKVEVVQVERDRGRFSVLRGVPGDLHDPHGVNEDETALHCKTGNRPLSAPEDAPLSAADARRIITDETPALLEAYRALAEELRQIFDFQDDTREHDADKPEMSAEELAELYEAIAEFAEGYDIDSIDALLKQAKDYQIPEPERERFTKTERCVKDSDWDGLRTLLSER